MVVQNKTTLVARLMSAMAEPLDVGTRDTTAVPGWPAKKFAEFHLGQAKK